MANSNEYEGLTQAQVSERAARGLANTGDEKTSRSFAEILQANVLTRFNAVLGSLFLIVILVGHINDGLFGLVLILNSLIGIIQELRAKQTLDRLSLITAPRARVIRDGLPVEIPYEQVVVDDLLQLGPGDQVVVDGTVLSSNGLEIDEAMLTGESLPVRKEIGEEVLSGSYTLAGTGIYRAIRVGAAAYSQKIADEAREFSLSQSELRGGIDRILKWIFYSLVPVAGLLWSSQMRAGLPMEEALIGTVAGIVGIIPQGLVLLTSITFALSIVALGRQRVLVQELPAVEILARVDVFCVDKTGTLTDGTLQIGDVIELGSGLDIPGALGAICAASSHQNPTLGAIAADHPDPGWLPTGTVPFSPERKWSYAGFVGQGHWILGAPEILLESMAPDEAINERVATHARAGFRVLMLAVGNGPPENYQLPDQLQPAALILIAERIREDVAPAMRYFRDEAVTVKVISGDNPHTARSIADRAGILPKGEPVDARALPEEEAELAEIMAANDVFGRVTPYQKQRMVKALQSSEHVVAMTGDGVNDVLALKEADLGLAMGSGVTATRSVARIILLDGKFSTLPNIVAEGRRLMANLELVANLFLFKTISVLVIDLVTAISARPFPFLPRHLTLIGELSIGIPAFFLALEPNLGRYRPGFVKRILQFVIPSGSLAGSFTLAAFYLVLSQGVPLKQARTAAALTLLLSGMGVLLILVRPLSKYRVVLTAGLIALTTLIFAVPLARTFFALNFPEFNQLAPTALLTILSITAIETYWRWRVKPGQRNAQTRGKSTD